MTVNAQSSFQLNVARLQIPGDFAQTSDHGYIIGGNMFDTASGNLDVYALVKIDSLGNEQWSALYHDFGHDSYITSLFQDSNGNYIFSGRPDGTVINECVMTKVNSSGNLLWSRNFSIPGYHSDIASHCLETNDGKYAMAMNQYYGGSYYVSLIKLETNGNILWEKNFSDSINYIARCNWIAQTTDHGFIITGEAYGQYCYLLRTDSTGNPLWCKIYSLSFSNNPGTCVKQTLDGGYIITTSNFLTGGGYANIIKTDSVGQIQWTKTLSGSEYHFLFSVEQTADSNFVFAGGVGDYNSISQKLLIVKMDQVGDTLWTKTYQSGGNFNLTGLKINETEDRGLLVLNQIFIAAQIMKTDQNGNLNCGQSYSTTLITQYTSQANDAILTVDSTLGQTNKSLNRQPYPPSSNISCLSLGSENDLDIQINISLFPNPATEKIAISCSVQIQAIRIYNSLGVLLIKIKYESEINISNLSPGIYFISIQTKERELFRKLIKE